MSGEITAKERLEEIESNPAFLHKDIIWVIKYAKERSERVRELEKLCEQLIGEEWMNDEGLYESELMKLDRQNKRYREALEKIEQVTNYEDEANEVAHQALEKEE